MIVSEAKRVLHTLDSQKTHMDRESPTSVSRSLAATALTHTAHVCTHTDRSVFAPPLTIKGPGFTLGVSKAGCGGGTEMGDVCDPDAGEEAGGRRDTSVCTRVPTRLPETHGAR